MIHQEVRLNILPTAVCEATAKKQNKKNKTVEDEDIQGNQYIQQTSGGTLAFAGRERAQ